MTIGTRLRQCREKKRLSQQEVADHLGVGQSTYSQWESDQSTFKIDHLIRLAEIFNVEISDLFPTKIPTCNPEKFTFKPNDAQSGLIQEILESKNEVIRLLREENERLKKFNLLT